MKSSTMQIRDIRKALEALGVELQPPAAEQDISQLEEELQLTLHESLRQLYRQFDGLTSYDSKSQMALWPLERIVGEKELSQVGPEGKVFAIGDFLVDSDLLMSPLSIEGPITLLYEQRTLAPSPAVFLAKLAAKEFDFLE